MTTKKVQKALLKPYFVGQGMCALIDYIDSNSQNKGILLDCGAGTPVKRDIFERDEKLFIKNSNSLDEGHLLKDIEELNDITLIVSHLDADHYRLLRWSPKLLEKIKTIYIPSGQIFPDRLNKKIQDKVIVHTDKNLPVEFNGFKLHSYRTRPSSNKNYKNNNGIVVLIESSQGKFFLFPGDYLFSMIASDESESIKSLCNIKYEFMSVPHHGSIDSGINNIDVNLISEIQSRHDHSNSLAFFSVGNHRGYNHPHEDTVNSYANAGFSIYFCKKIKNVRRSITYELK